MKIDDFRDQRTYIYIYVKELPVNKRKETSFFTKSWRINAVNR